MRMMNINHLAFITRDMEATIRFYRDLLGMELCAGIGHDGYRHYFFRLNDEDMVAFFEYDEARPMEYKFAGARTDKPLGFDHVSITVESLEDLFALKDQLEAAGFKVDGAVDHGIIWSIYFHDHNNIPLEASWNCMELLKTPAIEDDDPMAIAAEGSAPQPGHWPEVTNPTPAEEMIAHDGNGYAMRQSFLRQGLARNTPELEAVLARSSKTEAAE